MFGFICIQFKNGRRKYRPSKSLLRQLTSENNKKTLSNRFGVRVFVNCKS